MKRHLTDTFLLEFYKLCFHSKEVLEVGLKHLELHYIVNEEYREIWRSLKQQYSISSKIPSLGVLSQLFNSSKEKDNRVREVLEKISNLPMPSKEDIVQAFEEYIKDKLSIEFYEKFADIYNKGEKEKARALLIDFSEILAKFSVKKDVEYYERVFKDFEERNRERIVQGIEKKFYVKTPFGIDCVDIITHGGLDLGDTALFMSQSGMGKSKLLKWIGVNAARRGFNVLHVQAEGTRSECFALYDATWTGQFLYEIEKGIVGDEVLKGLKKVVNEIKFDRGDIWVHTIEELRGGNWAQVEKVAQDIIKMEGHLDMILVDYLELFDPPQALHTRFGPGDERFRRELVANSMKNTAVSLPTRVVALTQASTVSPEKLNDPDYYMTRFDISEFKGLIKPFSLFITLNQTEDEYLDNLLRLYFDKVRKYRGKQKRHIVTAFKYEKFYDGMATRELYPLELDPAAL